MLPIMSCRGASAEVFHAWPWWCVPFRSAAAESERVHVENARVRRRGIKRGRAVRIAKCLHLSWIFPEPCPDCGRDYVEVDCS
jgi:hypothetical protein